MKKGFALLLQRGYNKKQGLLIVIKNQLVVLLIIIIKDVLSDF